MHIRRFHTHLYYIKRGVVIKKYVIVVSFQLYTIHILKFFFTYFKRVCPDHPIKLLMLFLFMFSVEGHTEHYTETRREIISYKTLITHWNHDWCEYIDDFFIFYFHFKSFNLLIVAVMMKHCRFCEQQAWQPHVYYTTCFVSLKFILGFFSWNNVIHRLGVMSYSELLFILHI